jgi:hypothetical protein
MELAATLLHNSSPLRMSTFVDMREFVEQSIRQVQQTDDPVDPVALDENH